MAEFRVDQATPGTGTPDISRHDLIAGEVITLTAITPAPGAGVSFTWEIIDKIGSTATLSSSAGTSVTLGSAGAITQPCGFRIRLTANDNGAVTIIDRVFSVTTANLDLRVPLFAETSSAEDTLAVNDPGNSIDNAIYVNRAGLGVAEQNWRGWAEWAYRITTAVDAAAGGAIDSDAIHDNVAAEIAAIAEKVTPIAGDILVIEDSADSNNKKRLLIGNLPATPSTRQDTYDNGAGITQSDLGGKVEIDDSGTTVTTDGLSVRKTTTDGIAAYFRNEQVGAGNTSLATSGKSSFAAPSAAQVGDVGHSFIPGRSETEGARTISKPWGVADTVAGVGDDFEFIIVDGDPDTHVTSGNPGSIAVDAVVGTVYKKDLNPSTWSILADKSVIGINQALKGMVLGTTYALVGSVYLSMGTIRADRSRVMLGTDQVLDTATLELRRFVGGNVIATLTATGLLQDVVPSGDITIAATDWYDLYLKADVATTNALLRGLKLEYSKDPSTKVRQSIDQTHTGVTPLLVGSLYLPAGTLQASSRCMLGTLVGGTGTIELKRFTGGASIATWAATGAMQDKVLGSNVVIPASDWYDLYLYGGAGPTVSVIKGLDWTVLV